MQLSDPLTSRAVLIGVSSYSQMDPLDSVARNLGRLEELLTDTAVWGLPKLHIAVLHNPTRDAALGELEAAALAATDTLLVYFAGHGLLDPDSSALLLAMPETSASRLRTALRYDELRREVLSPDCRAPRKVVVLDCCFSGRAGEGFLSGEPSGLADQAAIEKTYLMMACGKQALAVAPPGEDYTAFTGELIGALEAGDPNAGDVLDMGTLYFAVRSALNAKGRPIPEERARNDGRSIAIARNRLDDPHGAAARGPAPAAAGQRPEFPPAYAAALRRPPSELFADLVRLYGLGAADTARQLLEASIRRRSVQEAASILHLLRREAERSVLATAVRAAALRDATEIVDLTLLLIEFGDDDVAQRVLDAAALRPESEVAATSAALHAARRPEADAALLVRAARAGDIPRTISLFGMLWASGRPDAGRRLLDTVAAGLDPVGRLALAAALRSAGREEAAFPLYAQSADELAVRTSAEITSVVDGMTGAGMRDQAATVVEAAMRHRSAVKPALELVRALHEAALPEPALLAARTAAGLLPEFHLVPLLDALVEADYTDEVDEFCASAAARLPVDGAFALVDRLRYLGQPVTATRLLRSLPRMLCDQADRLAPYLRRLVSAERTQDAAVLGEAVKALLTTASPATWGAFIGAWLDVPEHAAAGLGRLVAEQMIEQRKAQQREQSRAAPQPYRASTDPGYLSVDGHCETTTAAAFLAAADLSRASTQQTPRLLSQLFPAGPERLQCTCLLLSHGLTGDAEALVLQAFGRSAALAGVAWLAGRVLHRDQRWQSPAGQSWFERPVGSLGRATRRSTGAADRAGYPEIQRYEPGPQLAALLAGPAPLPLSVTLFVLVSLLRGAFGPEPEHLYKFTYAPEEQATDLAVYRAVGLHVSGREAAALYGAVSTYGPDATEKLAYTIATLRQVDALPMVILEILDTGAPGFAKEILAAVRLHRPGRERKAVDKAISKAGLAAQMLL